MLRVVGHVGLAVLDDKRRLGSTSSDSTLEDTKVSGAIIGPVLMSPFGMNRLSLNENAGNGRALALLRRLEGASRPSAIIGAKFDKHEAVPGLFHG